MPENEEVDINLRITANTQGADQTAAALNKVKAAADSANAAGTSSTVSSSQQVTSPATVARTFNRNALGQFTSPTPDKPAAAEPDKPSLASKGFSDLLAAQAAQRKRDDDTERARQEQLVSSYRGATLPSEGYTDRQQGISALNALRNPIPRSETLDAQKARLAREEPEPVKPAPPVSPAFAKLVDSSTKAQQDAYKVAEQDKQRIDAEYQKNITADRLKQQKQEQEEAGRLYQQRLTQQKQYDSAYKLAQKEGRAGPGGPQGPGQPPEIPPLGDDSGSGGGKRTGLLSNTSILRAGAALVGIGLGINILAGIAREFNRAIVGAVDSELKLEQASRAVSAEMGKQVGLAQNAAKQFLANPETKGTTQEFLSSVAAVQDLTQAYGLNQQQAVGLVGTAGALAKIHSIELPQAVSAVQDAIKGNVTALDKYGITLVNEVGYIKNVGYSYEELVGLYGKAYASQVLLNQSTAAIADQQKNAKSTSDELADAMDRLKRAADKALLSVGAALKGPVTNVANALASSLEDNNKKSQADADREEALKAINAQRQTSVTAVASGRSAVVSRSNTQNIDEEVAAYIKQKYAISSAIGAKNEYAYANESAIKADTTFGSAIQAQNKLFEDNRTAIQKTVLALQVLDAQKAQSASIGAALKGPDYTTGLADLQRQGAATAFSDVIAKRAQEEARKTAEAFRGQLVISVGLAVDPASKGKAEGELADFDRRAQARAAQGRANEAAGLAGRAAADAEARVKNLELGAQQRQLAVAGDIASLRVDTLSREGSIVSLQRQEADLADRTRVAQRENLDLLNAQVQARQAARSAAEALNNIQYAQNTAALKEQAIRADVRRGALSADALLEIPKLRQQERGLSLQAPRAEYEAAVAERPGELIQRQLDKQADTRQLELNTLEGQRRALDDQLVPLQQAQRLTDERTAAIGRQLELATLAETKERTAAQYAYIEAQLVTSAAEVAARQAERWAAGIHDGLTDLDRATGLLKNLPGQTVATGEGGGPDRQEAPQVKATGQGATADRQDKPPPPPVPIPRDPGAPPPPPPPIDRVKQSTQYIAPGSDAVIPPKPTVVVQVAQPDKISAQASSILSNSSQFVDRNSALIDTGRGARQSGGFAQSGQSEGSGRGHTINVNFTGPVAVRSDQDIDDIARKSAIMTMQALQLAAKNDVTPQAPPTGLVGAYG